MSTLVFTNAYINISANDLSAYGNQVNFSYEAETLDETSFGDDTRINKGGLKVWGFEINFNQDFADNLLDEILFNLVGQQVTVAFRPVNGAISTGNPEYTGTGLIQSYKPIGNSVGELAGASLTIECAGTLVRDVTP